jgi:small subunit ribosomal protein S8e|tara:strand:- start:503 stop:943 length:441 start_codon:yes stop_codon:yes gene_type:complete
MCITYVFKYERQVAEMLETIDMAQWHGISRRKASGGRRVAARGKRSTEISSEKQYALLGAPKRKIYRNTGGNVLVRVLSDNRCSANDPKTGKTVSTTITNVVENASNPNYVRRNILTKGAIIETDKGRVRITSRPGHDGVINGILL